MRFKVLCMAIFAMSSLSLQAQSLPNYFVKIVQNRTLFAANENPFLHMRVGNQSEGQMLRARRLPDLLQHLIVTDQDGNPLKLSKPGKSREIYKKVGTLDIGNHVDLFINLRKWYPDIMKPGVYSFAYKDDIYNLTGKDIRVSNANLPDLKSTFVLKTSVGDIAIKLSRYDAPNHARNFAILASEGFYKAMIWHRVIADMVIQTGDPKGSGVGGSGFPVNIEISPLIKHKQYHVGMARTSELDSATSQFYICTKDVPELDGQYTVFGKVVDGFDVVDAIAQVSTTGRSGRPPDRPTKDIHLYKIEIQPPGAP